MNELIKAINELKKEKNAIILGHYYQKGEIQDIADYVGDSLALAQWAAKTEADIIVMCGVHFMGETAKVLCPNKKVLVPDMEAGCSLADSCPADKFAQFVKEHQGPFIITYHYFYTEVTIDTFWQQKTFYIIIHFIYEKTQTGAN